VRQWNEEISAAAVRAGEIIKRLRFFLGRSETQRQPAGIREIIDESVALVAFETRRVGVTVCREFDDTNPEVYVDRLQIQQVMVNLLHNACEALEEKTGGARILTIRAAAAGEYVEVSVADNGSGLKAPEDPNIFEPFVTAKPEGLGMGLAISRTIVEAHGGRIWATANPKEGATFHFTLPGAGGGQSDVR
jgi:two-component system sensor kinase FixL